MDNSYGKQAVQEKILEIACEIKRLCEKHGIEYYISDGSCLGAVRHGGFIPWDDDFDIVMTRENYDRFAEVAKKELRAPFFYQDTETDPAYPCVFAKVRNSETTFIEEDFAHLPMNHGIYVDIFYLTGVPDGKLPAKIHELGGFLSFFFQEFARVRTPGFKQKLCSAILKITKALHLKKSLARLGLWLNCRWPAASCETVSYSMGKFNYQETTMERRLFGKPQDILFEGVSFSTVEDTHGYLTHLYGDYRQLPPEESRSKRMHAQRFDTNVSYREYLRNE